jgi:hypothetical protein
LTEMSSGTGLMTVGEKSRVILLICGFIASLIFAVTDVTAGLLYPGYSYTSQAISELFAIGSPTSSFVVPIFTFSSILVLAFSVGVWVSAGGSRTIHLVALMFVGNAVNGLLLWNVYPMHMRGAEATFSDTMHIILAGVGVFFVLLVVIIVVLTSHDWLRIYSVVSLIVLLVPGALVFMTIPGLVMGEPTPYVGLTERISTYGYYVWQTIFIKHLINQGKSQMR